MRSTRTVALVVLCGAIAAIVSASNASATPPPNVPLPSGYSTPWDALRAGAYTGTDLSTVTGRIAQYTVSGGDGFSAADAFATVSADEQDYALGRIIAAAAKAGAAPALDELAVVGAGSVALPVIGAVVTAGTLALTGYEVYKYVTHGQDGVDHTNYLEVSRKALFGAWISVPSALTYGTDYRWDTRAEGYPASNSTFGSAPIGWVELTCNETNRCTSMPHMSAHAKYWTFNYAANIAHTFGYPNTGGQSYGDFAAPQGIYGTPKYADCVASMTSCIGPAYSGQNPAVTDAVEHAASDTALNFSTYNGPVPIYTDTDAAASGHMSWTHFCTYTPGAGHCIVPYVPADDFETMVPQRVTSTDPGGANVTTITKTVPDMSTLTPRTAVTDATSDPCGKAIINHLIEPTAFPYYGCTTKLPSAPSVPATAPMFTLPAPRPNETVTEYLARISDLGYVGTATVTTASTTEDGYGPDSPVRVAYPDTTAPGGSRVLDPVAWPTMSPSLAVDTPLTITKNTSTATVVPTTSPGSCTCPPIDMSPITSMHFGSKFPFGAFGYVTSTLNLFDVSAVAPSFDISVSGVSGAHPIASPGHYAGNLSAFNTYMGYLRDMETFVLWIGAIWLVATRLLGLSWGGDLTEAADD